jgi:hypothetical protein
MEQGRVGERMHQRGEEEGESEGIIVRRGRRGRKRERERERERERKGERECLCVWVSVGNLRVRREERGRGGEEMTETNKPLKLTPPTSWLSDAVAIGRQPSGRWRWRGVHDIAAIIAGDTVGGTGAGAGLLASLLIPRLRRHGVQEVLLGWVLVGRGEGLELQLILEGKHIVGY